MFRFAEVSNRSRRAAQGEGVARPYLRPPIAPALNL